MREFTGYWRSTSNTLGIGFDFIDLAQATPDYSSYATQSTYTWAENEGTQLLANTEGTIRKQKITFSDALNQYKSLVVNACRINQIVLYTEKEQQNNINNTNFLLGALNKKLFRSSDGKFLGNLKEDLTAYTQLLHLIIESCNKPEKPFGNSQPNLFDCVARLEKANISNEILDPIKKSIQRLQKPSDSNEEKPNDIKIIKKFLEIHKTTSSNSYWTKERKKNLTVEEIVRHANQGSTTKFAFLEKKYSGNGTREALRQLGVIGVRVKNCTVDEVRKAIADAIKEENSSANKPSL